MNHRIIQSELENAFHESRDSVMDKRLPKKIVPAEV